MTPVESSNISSVGYDPITKTMTVLFHAGTKYAYANVAEATFTAILKADSVGSAFNKLIKAKPAEHPFTRIS